VRTPADQLVLEMLVAALSPQSVDVVPEDFTPEQAIKCVLDKPPPLVCITAISPTRGSEVRKYCRQLRAHTPSAKILVLRPTLTEDTTRAIERMKEAGADCVVATTQAAIDAIAALSEGRPIPEEPVVPLAAEQTLRMA
jgi:DNA-binding NarL/FixJ family response regulator